MPLTHSPQAVAARSGAASWTLPVYAASLFLSAYLVFAVQPMFAKAILPKLGGTPAVWSVAMVFFQATLLAGYVYAHLLATYLSPRRAALTHLGLMAVTLAVALPIGPVADLGKPPSDGEALWLIGVFALSIGLPFFAVSANGPLLQAWFTRSGHEQAKDPYFLYGASNLGSLLALFSYPLVIEPWLTLPQQGSGWAWGFAVLGAGIAAAAGYAARGARSSQATGIAPAADESVGWRRRAEWVLLAFVPSALLIAVTAHISADVAAAPFLWVAPLALFLLTFIVCFQRSPVLSHSLMLRLQPVAVCIPIVLLAAGLQLDWQIMLPMHLLAFFITAMACHGTLVARRPSAGRLTEFYMLMSLGGVLGGAFAALVAPKLFSTVLEYPLLLVAGLACRPGLFPRRHLVLLGGAAIAAALAAGLVVLLDAGADLITALKFTGVAPAIGICLALLGFRPAWLLAALLPVFAVVATARHTEGAADTVRSFYGVHRLSETPDGRYRRLMHGTTVHGVQEIRSADGAPLGGRPEPIAYYHASGPIAGALDALRNGYRTPASVGIVGVGSGAMACHARPGERWSLYEIDREVVAIARDPRRFSFLSHCAQDAALTLGDARISLTEAAPGAYDVLVIDAFSSDAIPVHLLTRQAVALYRSRVSARGAVVLHVSNRNMALADVVAAVGRAEGLAAFERSSRVTPEEAERNIYPAQVVVLAPAGGEQEAALVAAGFDKLTPTSVAPWTDDYADVIGAIWRKLRPL